MGAILPLGQNQWLSVGENYNVIAIRKSWPVRSAESLRAKFKSLRNSPKPTGDPNCPEEIRLAKRIQREIDAHAEVAPFHDDDENDATHTAMVEGGEENQAEAVNFDEEEEHIPFDDEFDFGVDEGGEEDAVVEEEESVAATALVSLTASPPTSLTQPLQPHRTTATTTITARRTTSTTDDDGVSSVAANSNISTPPPNSRRRVPLAPIQSPSSIAPKRSGLDIDELRSLSEAARAQAAVGMVSSATVKRSKLDNKIEAMMDSRKENDNFMRMYLLHQAEQRQLEQQRRQEERRYEEEKRREERRIEDEKRREDRQDQNLFLAALMGKLFGNTSNHNN